LSQKLLFNRPEKQEWREKEDGKFSELLDGNSVANAYMGLDNKRLGIIYLKR
jgi:hypothetical protein